MTELEEKIVKYLDGRPPRSTNSFRMAKVIGDKSKYGPRGKQILGMAVGRMKAKGIEANYGALT